MVSRRNFLGSSTAMLAGAALLPKFAWALDAENPFRQNIGIQLYTLRDAISHDAGAALAQVAEIGYKQVEAYGFPDCDAILDAAEANGLPIHSSHINSNDLIAGQWGSDAQFDRTLEKATEHGLKHLVVPYINDTERKTLDDYRRIAERCNRAAERAKSAGIQLSYHNHAFEFQPKVDDKRGFDIFVDEFSNDMKFEVDVFWVQAAGVDPVSLLEKLDGRITQLHLKDLASDIDIPTYDGMPKEGFKEIGNGVVAIEAIIEKAGSVGVEHCHVEQDHSPHPVKSVRESMAVLAKM